MHKARLLLRRAILPFAVVLLVMAAHYVWRGVFPERDPAQDRWATVAAAEQPSWFARYAETQSYWLGLSYATALAFAAVAIRRYREDRKCTSRNFAIGGITLTGFLAAAGCFLVGCCGSPMLAVYLSLFGARFLPFTKPLIFTLTAVTILLSWWWMTRRRRSSRTCSASGN